MQSNFSQTSLELINTEAIIKKLSSGNIKYEHLRFTSGRDKNKYLVELDNGLLAVFKSRAQNGGKGRKNEVMAYVMAIKLFGLTSTIPPTIEKTYTEMKGILQYYVSTDTELHASPYTVIKNIDRLSYADLQVLRYIACFHDVNIEGIIAWKDSSGKYKITSVDNEEMYPISDRYGETPLGKTDIDHYCSFSYDTDPFISKYTSFFNTQTMEKIQHIDEEMITDLYRENGYSVDKAYVDRFLINRDRVLEAYNLSLNVKNDDEEKPVFSLTI